LLASLILSLSLSLSFQELNCTLLLASSGIAVQTQEDAMMASLKGIIDMSKSVSSSMEKAVDTFTGVQVEELLIQFTPFYFKTPIYGTPLHPPLA
jgi:hypothetical protein